jgi:hypothetical protein
LGLSETPVDPADKIAIGDIGNEQQQRICELELSRNLGDDE